MNTAQDSACCTTNQPAASSIDQLNHQGRSPLFKHVAGVAALIVAWWLIYSNLEPFAGLFTHMLSKWIGFSATASGESPSIEASNSTGNMFSITDRL